MNHHQFEFPLLAVGQNACRLAADINCRAPFQEISCDEFRRLSSSSPTMERTRGSVPLRKRVVGVHQTPNSWVEGFNDKSLSLELLDSLRCSLEEWEYLLFITARSRGVLENTKASCCSDHHKVLFVDKTTGLLVV